MIGRGGWYTSWYKYGRHSTSTLSRSGRWTVWSVRGSVSERSPIASVDGRDGRLSGFRSAVSGRRHPAAAVLDYRPESTVHHLRTDGAVLSARTADDVVDRQPFPRSGTAAVFTSTASGVVSPAAGLSSVGTAVSVATTGSADDVRKSATRRATSERASLPRRSSASVSERPRLRSEFRRTHRPRLFRVLVLRDSLRTRRVYTRRWTI